MSFVLPVPLVQKTYTLSPSLLALKPVALSPIQTGITLQTVVQEPPKVEVKKTVEEVTTTTEVKEITTTTTEVPLVSSTCLWNHGPVNFYEIQQYERK